MRKKKKEQNEANKAKVGYGIDFQNYMDIVQIHLEKLDLESNSPNLMAFDQGDSSALP